MWQWQDSNLHGIRLPPTPGYHLTWAKPLKTKDIYLQCPLHFYLHKSSIVIATSQVNKLVQQRDLPLVQANICGLAFIVYFLFLPITQLHPQAQGYMVSVTLLFLFKNKTTQLSRRRVLPFTCVVTPLASGSQKGGGNRTPLTLFYHQLILIRNCTLYKCYSTLVLLKPQAISSQCLHHTIQTTTHCDLPIY